MKRLGSVVVALGFLVAACGQTDGSEHSVTASAAPPTTATTTDVIVTKVFDGDSFEAEVDGDVVEVRLVGINAPEGDECHGDAARSRLEELLSGAITLVEEGADTTDRFGRLLRTVLADGQSVGAIMVEEGHALAIQGGGSSEQSLVELTDHAFARDLGMWSVTACGEEVPRVRVAEVKHDPPGRDDDNATEEWVVIVNDSSGPVDIAGWILRDESSSHRYLFAGDESMAAGSQIRIRTGCGYDNRANRYWCADDPVWSNGGDTVILQTAAGTVVDRVRYGEDI